jgi:hypothetical protein
MYFGCDYIMAKTRYIHWDDNGVRFVLAKHSSLDFVYSASSLTQQTAGRHAAPLGHIIPIPN